MKIYINMQNEIYICKINSTRNKKISLFMINYNLNYYI